MHTAFGQETNFLLAHEREKICGRLEVPLKLDSGGDNSFGDGDGAFSIDQEIGVEERNVLDVVTGNEFGEVVDNPVHAIGVEAAFVKDHVGAVVTLVGAADAAG